MAADTTHHAIYDELHLRPCKHQVRYLSAFGVSAERSRPHSVCSYSQAWSLRRSQATCLKVRAAAAHTWHTVICSSACQENPDSLIVVQMAKQDRSSTTWDTSTSPCRYVCAFICLGILVSRYSYSLLAPFSPVSSPSSALGCSAPR